MLQLWKCEENMDDIVEEELGELANETEFADSHFPGKKMLPRLPYSRCMIISLCCCCLLTDFN